ncbi:MAG: hypothetical protein ACOC4M_08005 [Promethearchaeia archaeon]
MVTYILRTRVPRFKKDPEQNVDKRMRNLFLIKCLIFVIIPWTLGGMFVDRITAVFALFYVNGLGIHFNGTLLIFTAVLFFLAIIWQGFTLSYKSRYAMFGITVWNLLLIGFYLVFFLLHFPMLSWFSPGFYGMIWMDILILRRSFLMMKMKR